MRNLNKNKVHILRAAIAASMSVLPLAAGAADYVIEAENFVAQGGTYVDGQPNKVSVYSVNGATAINYVNRADYTDYQINVATHGYYNVQYAIGTSVASGAAIELLVQNGSSWESQGQTNVPVGHWDSFQPLNASHEVILPAGTVNLRVYGAGSNDWQWNLDSI